MDRGAAETVSYAVVVGRGEVVGHAAVVGRADVLGHRRGLETSGWAVLWMDAAARCR